MTQQINDLELVTDALHSLKAKDVVTLEVAAITPLTDYMVIATGTSPTHVTSIASYVYQKAKAGKLQPHGMEGQDVGEWVLIDLGTVVVHVMLEQVREYYKLEKLWNVPPVAENTNS